MEDGQQQQQHTAEQGVKHEADPSTEAPSSSALTATAAATPTSSSLPAQSASNTLTSTAAAPPSTSDTTSPQTQPATQAPASPTKRPSSPKQKGSKGNSNGTTDKEKDSKEKDKGFMASVKLFLLSCVGPSSAHPPELDVRDAHSGAAPAAPGTSTPKATEATAKDTTTTTTTASPPADAAAATTTTEAGDKLPAIITTPPSPSASAHTRASTVHGPDSLDAGVEVVTDPRSSVLIPSVPPSPVMPSGSGGGTPGGADAMDEDVIVPPTAAHTELLPDEETAGVTSGAVVPPGATVSAITQHEEDESRKSDKEREEDGEDVEMGDDEDDYEDRLIANGGVGIPIGPDGVPRPLLPPLAPNHLGRKCLVLDLDETLVHSSFKPVPNPDYIVPVEIEHRWHNVYVLKRPGVDQFLKDMGEIYEIVVYTASLSLYADPVLDKLDIHHVVHHRLFRESCYLHRGASYVKDLSQLGRPIADVLILDNSPASYIFHPNNAVPVSSWFNDPHDRELEDMAPFLVDLVGVDDVRGVLDGAI